MLRYLSVISSPENDIPTFTLLFKNRKKDAALSKQILAHANMQIHTKNIIPFRGYCIKPAAEQLQCVHFSPLNIIVGRIDEAPIDFIFFIFTFCDRSKTIFCV